ncbi:MAG TPA: hypothetical protein V6C97_18765 [Oculatellaceae cyanobacterium]
MSDAGTMITIRRHDEANLTELDRAHVSETIRKIQATDQHKDASGERFRFRVGDCHPVGSALFVVLSEYWEEGIAEGFYGVETFEPLLEHDKEGVEAVSKSMQNELGREYKLELNRGNW